VKLKRLRQRKKRKLFSVQEIFESGEGTCSFARVWKRKERRSSQQSQRRKRKNELSFSRSERRKLIDGMEAVASGVGKEFCEGN